MSAEPVVLLHGIWMPGSEMWFVKRRLEADGAFAGHLFSYPSVADSLDENAARLHAFVLEKGFERVHFVGHSLGGVVALRMLATCDDVPPGRVVCLGSPLAGSRAAEVLGGHAWGRKLAGRTLSEGVVHEPASRWALPVTAERDVGIIAGSLSLGLGRIVTSFAGENDGTVAVEETRLEGAKDHLTLPVSHTTLATSRDVADQVAAFLQRGEFLRDV